MKKHIRLIIIFAALAALLLLQIPVSAGGRLCISQLQIQTGDSAAEKLEADGFTVIYQNLNPAGGKRIYLGYKLGEKAVTGIAVSSDYSGTLSSGGIDYKAVSDVNLNEGTNGSPVYLYYTTDAKAGSGIAALTCVKDNKDGSVNLLDSFGDGSVPVMTVDGRPADFDEGIAERDLYLFFVREHSCLPYISEIKTVNVGAGESAFLKIAESGCLYFIAEPIYRSGGTSTYLCFGRTDDADNAVRNAAVSVSPEIDGVQYKSAGKFSADGSLYYTKDASAGEPIVQITNGLFFGGTITSGDWAKLYFGSAQSFASSYIYEEDAYAALAQSTDEYMQLAVKNAQSGADSGLYMILSAQGQNVSAEEAAVTLPEQTGSQELLRDTEETGIEKTTSPDVTAQADNNVAAYGSAIGGGSLIAIAVLAIISVIIAFVFVTFKGKKKKSDI